MSEQLNHWLRLSDKTTWPRPGIEDDGLGLAWRLTYGTPSREDLLAAASVVSAYSHMMLGTTRERRDFVCREIRAALAPAPAPDDAEGKG